MLKRHCGRKMPLSENGRGGPLEAARRFSAEDALALADVCRWGQMTVFREASRSATYCESMIYERSSFVCPLDCASSQSHGLCGEKPCSSKPSDGRLSGRRFY